MTELKLTEVEKETVKQCLLASFKGTFFPDWEFETLIGVKKDKLGKLISDFPSVDYRQPHNVRLIKSCLGNLVGYPHGKQEELKEFTPASVSDILNILKKLKVVDE